MGLRLSVEQLFQLGRRITGNVIDIGMALLKEAGGYSKAAQTLYTFLSGLLPGSDEATEREYVPPRPYQPVKPTPPVMKVVRSEPEAESAGAAAEPEAEAAVAESEPDHEAGAAAPAQEPEPEAEAAAVSAPEPEVEAAESAPEPEAEATSEPEAAVDAPSEADLKALTKKQLQGKCDELGLSYKSKDTKAVLIKLVLEHGG